MRTRSGDATGRESVFFLSPLPTPPHPLRHSAQAYNLWHDRYHRHEDINRSAPVSVFIIISFSAMLCFLLSRALLFHAPHNPLPLLLLLGRDCGDESRDLSATARGKLLYLRQRKESRVYQWHHHHQYNPGVGRENDPHTPLITLCFHPPRNELL